MTYINPGNNSGLYDVSGNAIPVDTNVFANNISATGNVTVDGYIYSQGSITTDANFVGNLVGNVIGNISLAGSNTQVIFNDDGVTGGSNAFRFNKATDTVTIEGKLDVAGNISGAYILGDGSQLTGLPATYSNANVATFMANYGSNTISTSGNITGGYFLGNGSQLTGLPQQYGNSNVVTLLSNFGSNNISTTGNITAGYVLGNGSQLTGLPQQYGNANVAAYLASGTDSQNIITTGTVQGEDVTAVDLVQAARIQTTGTSGNITGANYISANYYVGDGGLLSNITASYGNANVAAYLPTYTGNLAGGNLSVAGNVTGAYILGNGSQLTGLPASYSNANVATYLASGTDTQNIVTTGNVQGTYIIGNGSTLTNITGANVSGTVANASYATTANLSNYATTAFNVSGANVSGTVANATYALNANAATYAGTVTTAAQPNITSVGTLSSVSVTGNVDAGNLRTVGAISATGNITGSYIFGNGSQLTGLPATYANANVANYLPTYSGNIGVGNLTGSYVKVTSTTNTTAPTDGALIVAGGVGINNDLRVGGTIYGTFAGNISGNLVVPGADSDVIFNNTGNAGASSNFQFDNGNSLVKVTGSISASGNITGGNFIGSGQYLTSLPGANVTGTVANATYATTANLSNYATTAFNVSGANVSGAVANATYATTANLANYATTAFNVNGANVSGTVANATYATSAGTASTVTANAQANITSVGTLTSLSVSGNVDAGNLRTAGVVSATGNVTGGNIITTGAISGAGNIYGTYLHGDGSNITGVVAGSSSTQFSVKNTAGYALAKGTPVYATGSVGASTVLEVSASRADTVGTMPAIGLLTTALNSGDVGYAISVGTLQGLNTSTYTPGQELFIAATGGITGTRPTGTNVVQPIGAAGRIDSSTGTIETNIWNYYQLPNLGNGNVWIGNASGVPTETVAYGNANVANYLPTYSGALTASSVSATGNITGAYFFGNGSQLTGISTSLSGNMAGNISGIDTYSLVNVVNYNGTAVSVTGNVNTTNIILPNGGKILGDFSTNPVTGGRTVWQTTNTSTNAPTYMTAVPGPNNTNTLGAVNGLFASTDWGNSQLFGMYSYNNEARLNATRTGTASYVPLTLYTNNTERVKIDTSGNVGIANSSPVDKLAVTGTAYVSGNITGGNIYTAGEISATGNITGAYFIGNGSQLTGITGSSSNSFATIAANGTNIVAASATDTLTLTPGTNITMTGNATTKTVTISASGGGTPGGNTTEVQFNNAGSFAGNANVTFNNTTGNLATGNIVFQTATNNTTSTSSGVMQNWIQQKNPKIGNSATFSTYAAARYLFGGGLGPNSSSTGDFGTSYEPFNNGRNARMYLADRFTQTDNGVRSRGLTITQAIDVSGNINSSNVNTRTGSFVSELALLGGSGNVVGGSPGLHSPASLTLIVGNSSPLNGSGPITVTAASTVFPTLSVGSGSTLTTGVGVIPTIVQNGTLTNYHAISPNFASGTSTNFSVVHLQPSSGNGWGIGTAPTNYYFLLNQDVRSSSKIGPIRDYYDRSEANTAVSGNVTIDYSTGTSQTWFANGNITIDGFGNATVGDGTNNNILDTVTLIIKQGATPYTLTFPTGNSAIQYSNGVNTAAPTANGTIMVTATAYYNNNTSATNYLVTISPEFS